jgi:SAM-dependent methyltransferase
MTDDWLEVNRAMWDERVPIHVAGDFYDVPSFLAGRSTLRDFELAEMGEVDGCTLVHPQCHFGLDTLSWARRGARVTGLDFSPPAIEAARQIAAQAGIPAQFLQASVYDAAAAVGGRQFDVVYTGLGAIIWLPDIERWAHMMVSLLTPGGRFYLAEFHPFTSVFGHESFEFEQSYFDRGPHAYVEPGTYADLEAPTEHNRSIEWTWTIGDVATALSSAGLHIEFLHEYDYALFPRWPFLERDDEGRYRLPAHIPSIPLMFSLRATRPT